MSGDTALEGRELVRAGQFAVEEQVAGLDKVAPLGELIDRITAIEQQALIAVDIGDLGLAARRRGKARVVSEMSSLLIETGDVDDVRSERGLVNRKAVPYAVNGDGRLCSVRLARVVLCDAHLKPPNDPTEGRRGTRPTAFCHEARLWLLFCTAAKQAFNVTQCSNSLLPKV